VPGSDEWETALLAVFHSSIFSTVKTELADRFDSCGDAAIVHRADRPADDKA